MPSRPSSRAAPGGAKANLATFAGEPLRELKLRYCRNQPGMLLWEVPGNVLPDGQPMSTFPARGDAAIATEVP